MDMPTLLLAERFLQLVTKHMARNLVEEFVQADQAASVSAIEMYVSQACDMYLGGPTDPRQVILLDGIEEPPGANIQVAFEWAKHEMLDVYRELIDLARNPNLWQKPID